MEVEDLAKIYRGEIPALDGVTFQVEPGEVYGYLGRNGAGKTTTVRILCTLTRPTSGRAVVLGHEVTADAAAVRRLVGVALQESALDALMSAREHLDLLARLSGLSKEQRERRTEELLEMFELTGAADRRVASYSGGMRQRLGVALAMVHRPPVLFLDEPTAGLDPPSRRALWDRLRDLRAEGVTVLLTTQYMEEAEALCDLIAIVHKGRLVEEGTAAELRTRTGAATLEDAFITLTGES